MTTADDRARIDRLERENDSMRTDIADLTRRLAKVEAFKERIDARTDPASLVNQTYARPIDAAMSARD